MPPSPASLPATLPTDATTATAAGFESVFRNDLNEVRSFFDEKHSADEGRLLWRIVNLCAEKDRWYDVELFGGEAHAQRYGFHDHNPCPLAMLPQICGCMHEWLEADPKHIVAVHCKAGKGRTGMVISAYLIHAGVCATSDAALQFFDTRRTEDGKGVTIPSQRRYVVYYGLLCARGLKEPPRRPLTLHRIVMNGVPSFDADGGCDPYFLIQVPSAMDAEMRFVMDEVFDWRDKHSPLRHLKPADGGMTFEMREHSSLILTGDVKLLFADQDALSEDDEMCHCWIHTAFVDEKPGAPGIFAVTLTQPELDGEAKKDKKNAKFPVGFSLTFEFVAADAGPPPPLPADLQRSGTAKCAPPPTAIELCAAALSSASMESGSDESAAPPPSFGANQVPPPPPPTLGSQASLDSPQQSPGPARGAPRPPSSRRDMKDRRTSTATPERMA